MSMRIVSLLGKVVLSWTSDLNLKKSCVVVFAATLGAIIGMFLEYVAKGQDGSAMNQFRDFLGFVFEAPISNLVTTFAIIVIGVALCFFFQMKTGLAALYGGATVITILTTGLPQGQSTTGNVNDESSQLLNHAVIRNHEALQVRLLLLRQISTTEPSLVFCPDDRSPYYGQVEVLWRVYGGTRKFQQHSMNVSVGHNGTIIPVPPLLGNVNNYKYELTVRSPNMKTIYTNGSLRKNDRQFAVKVTTESGENSFFEWAFQPNVQSGRSENLSRCGSK